MENKHLKIVVYSDYICPFCFIGYLRIEKLKKEFTLDVEWRPFEIHPEIPDYGTTLEELPFPMDYLDAVKNNIERLAKEEGIRLNFPQILPNSRLALYISEFAKNKGKFDLLHGLIFEAYWKKGENIGDLNILIELAESVGLKKNEILDYIKSDEPMNRAKNYLLKIREYGINGVPAFFIGENVIVGAQPYIIFKNTIQKTLDHL